MIATADLWAAIEASWPAASSAPIGPFIWRDGAGGGNRVSAATAQSQPDCAALETIERKFASKGRAPLFQIRRGDDAFDKLLADRGYDSVDATLCLAQSVDAFELPTPERAYVSWPPIAAQRHIWHCGGIGAARIDVMARVEIPKTTVLARDGETPAGTAFMASLGSICVIHALEVPPHCRRKGVARSLMSQAAAWAKTNKATTLAALVTRANSDAHALYSSLGMREIDHYHYRRKGPV